MRKYAFLLLLILLAATCQVTSHKKEAMPVAKKTSAQAQAESLRYLLNQRISAWRPETSAVLIKKSPVPITASEAAVGYDVPE